MSDTNDMSGRADEYSASPSSAEHSGINPDHRASRKAPRPAAKSEKGHTKLVAITMDAEVPRVIHVEGLDDKGARHDLSDVDKAALVHRTSERRLEDLIEQAFEAGIAVVLGGESEPDAVEESPEDAAMRRDLLAPLIERSGVKRMMERTVLDRAILNTLIDHAQR